MPRSPIGRPLTVGANYYAADRDFDFAGTRDESLRRILVGGRYVLGPGVDIRSSVQYYQYDTPIATATTDGNNNAWFFVVGTNFTF